MKEIDKIKTLFGKEIDSSRFEWLKWGGVEGYDPEILHSNLLEEPDYNVIEGWCWSKNLPIRPRDYGIAVLFFNKITGEEIWIHFSDSYLESLYPLYEILK